MIKANELRVGNKLFYFIGEEGLEWEETTIDWQDIKECTENPDEFNKKHKPIPLTEEWLLRFGFTFKSEELGVRFYEKQVGIDFICFSKEGHWNINSGKSYWYMDRNFKSPQYVHQLQNLYFALTGEELSVL